MGWFFDTGEVDLVDNLDGGVATQPTDGGVGPSPNDGGPLPGGLPPETAPPLTGPTELEGSLGKTTVYPDDFVGPLPLGAVRESQYKQMTALYDRIDSGQSQLSVDSSGFTKDLNVFDDPMAYLQAAMDGAKWRQQQLDNLKDLVKTDAGFQMMSDMDKSKFKTTIGLANGAANETNYDDIDKASLQADGSKGPGTDITIGMNPALKSYANPGQTEDPWMTEREKYGLYHEMVHAWHGIQGDRATGKHNGINNSEWQAMGMGPYANQPISDNIIRAQLGKEQRPNYGGKTY